MNRAARLSSENSALAALSMTVRRLQEDAADEPLRVRFAAIIDSTSTATPFVRVRCGGPTGRRSDPRKYYDGDTTMLQTIAVSKLNESAENPRFELTNLKELAASIRAHGIIEPVIVRKDAGAKETYTIIAGHRRVAAATMAGLKDVPAVVNEIDAPNAHLHLVENIQRENLSHIEIATAIYAQIGEGTKATDLADSLGKPRSWVSKYKTIGEAMTKLVDENRSVEKLVELENINKLYEEALKVLGKSKDKAENKKQPKIDADDDTAHDMDGLDESEIAVLNELNELANKAMSHVNGTINVLPHGKTGFELKIVFKNEISVRKFINAD